MSGKFQISVDSNSCELSNLIDRVISHEPNQEAAEVLDTFNRHAVVHVDADAGVFDVTNDFEDPV